MTQSPAIVPVALPIVSAAVPLSALQGQPVESDSFVEAMTALSASGCEAEGKSADQRDDDSVEANTAAIEPTLPPPAAPTPLVELAAILQQPIERTRCAVGCQPEKVPDSAAPAKRSLVDSSAVALSHSADVRPPASAWEVTNLREGAPPRTLGEHRDEVSPSMQWGPQAGQEAGRPATVAAGEQADYPTTLSSRGVTRARFIGQETHRVPNTDRPRSDLSLSILREAGAAGPAALHTPGPAPSPIPALAMKSVVKGVVPPHAAIGNEAESGSANSSGQDEGVVWPDEVGKSPHAIEVVSGPVDAESIIDTPDRIVSGHAIRVSVPESTIRLVSPQIAQTIASTLVPDLVQRSDVPAAQIAASAGRELSSQASGVVRVIRFELHPVDLGRVQVRLAGPQEALRVQLGFAHEGVAAAMREGRRELEDALAQSGIGLDSLLIDAVRASFAAALPDTGPPAVASQSRADHAATSGQGHENRRSSDRRAPDDETSAGPARPQSGRPPARARGLYV